jgi:hypothetical protein
MHYARLALASFCALAAYFVSGGILFFALPGMKCEFMKYPGVYRSQDGMKKVMPYNMIGILMSVVVIAVFYAKMYPAGGGIVSGLIFGALIGIFAVFIYAVHNYTLLNIGIKLTAYESATYFIQWVIVGAAIGLIYKP